MQYVIQHILWNDKVRDAINDTHFHFDDNDIITIIGDGEYKTLIFNHMFVYEVVEYFKSFV